MLHHWHSSRTRRRGARLRGARRRGARRRGARRRGARLKLVCRAWRDGEEVRGQVRIEEVPLTDPFAAVSGTGSILRLHTDLMGPITLTQERPTITDTAFGVLSDLLTSIRDR